MYDIPNIIFSPGTAGDSLFYHRESPFTTVDQDNDEYSEENCADRMAGGWWYKECRDSNLNGFYYNGSHSSYGNGINWDEWQGPQYSAMRSEMKIRPADF